MKQSKLESSIEISANYISGFLIAWATWSWIAAPLYDNYGISGFTITVIFTIVSVIRSYFWRRFFNAELHKLVHKAVSIWLQNRLS